MTYFTYNWHPKAGIVLPFLLIAGLFSCKKASNNPAGAVTRSGYIYTVAGTGISGHTGDGGPARVAEIDATGVAMDGAGNLYITDYTSNKIRKISSAGVITTIAGNGTTVLSGDGGPAITAGFERPYYLACSSSGELYISDQAYQRVRKIDTSGIVTTFASLGEPAGIAVDAVGNVYITQSSECSVRMVNSAGVFSVFTGDLGHPGYSGDGGPAVDALLNQPRSVAADNRGNVYIADYDEQVVRVVDSNGIIHTFAGNGTKGYSGDGGLATQAQLNNPSSIAADNYGNVYIGDTYNQRIRKVDINGIITTFAGNGTTGFSGDGGPASAAQLNYTTGLAVDAAGNVYIADYGNNRVRRVNR